jgi:hypothetical protein
MEHLYTPLNPERREIRVVHLQSGEWTDEIECTLEVVSLDDSPDYMTLSYVWGDPTHTAKYAIILVSFSRNTPPCNPSSCQVMVH